MSDREEVPHSPWFIRPRPLDNGLAIIENGTYEGEHIAECEWHIAEHIVRCVNSSSWSPIETAPQGDEIFMAATADGRITIVRGSILVNMMKKSTPDHLQFPAIAWMDLPEPPNGQAQA